MRRYTNTTNPNLKGNTVNESTIEVKSLVQFELPVTIKENRVIYDAARGNP